MVGEQNTFSRRSGGRHLRLGVLHLDVVTVTGPVCYFVMFVIDLATSRVHVAGIVDDMNGRWVEQVARNLTDPTEGFLKDVRFLIHDRDRSSPRQDGRCKA